MKKISDKNYKGLRVSYFDSALWLCVLEIYNCMAVLIIIPHDYKSVLIKNLTFLQKLDPRSPQHEMILMTGGLKLNGTVSYRFGNFVEK